MTLYNYKNFLNEGKRDSDIINELPYCIFDWDDNILHMETKIYVKKNVNGEWIDSELSTSEFAKMKEKYDKYWDNEEYKLDFNTAFLNFRDFGPNGKDVFLNDVKYSLQNNYYGPSWKNFIETLTNGILFGIVTTRGHEPETIRKVIDHIVYNELTDYQQDKMLRSLMNYSELFDKDFEYLVDEYLDKCYFIGVMSEYFKEKFNLIEVKDTNKSKQIAVEYLIKEFDKHGKKVNLPVKIGFSDDDRSYSSAIKDIFITNKELFDNINFYVFDTSDPSIQGGIKQKI